MGRLPYTVLILPAMRNAVPMPYFLFNPPAPLNKHWKFR